MDGSFTRHWDTTEEEFRAHIDRTKEAISILQEAVRVAEGTLEEERTAIEHEDAMDEIEDLERVSELLFEPIDPEDL